MAGGKLQQMFDRDQAALLKERGLIGPRRPVNLPDFDRDVGKIVPEDGVFLRKV